MLGSFEGSFNEMKEEIDTMKGKLEAYFQVFYFSFFWLKWGLNMVLMIAPFIIFSAAETGWSRKLRLGVWFAKELAFFFFSNYKESEEFKFLLSIYVILSEIIVLGFIYLFKVGIVSCYNNGFSALLEKFAPFI